MEEKNESKPAPVAGLSQRAAEVAVGLVFLLIGLVVAFDSYRVGASWSSDGPQAGYFPFYIGLIMIVASAVTLTQAIFGKRRQDDKMFVEWHQLKMVFSVLGPAALFIGGIQAIGIYVASTIYIAIFMIWLGHYHWLKSVALGFMVSAVGFLTFEVWFQVPLYKGAFDPLSFLGY